jgi:hypothetical protein
MQMVRLTTCGDAFEAKVLVARLGAEGVVWSLRGAHDGPLNLGAVDVLVDADDYELARALLAGDPEWDGELAEPDAAPERETTGRDVLVLLVVVVVVVLFAIARMGARV